MWFRVLAPLFAGASCAFLIVGCSKVKSLLGRDEAPDATPVAAPVASVSAPAAPGQAGAVCRVESREVWGKNANRRAGLTVSTLGERTAIGLALGTRPQMLLIEPGGEARLVAANVPAGSPLSAPAARRDVQRVTAGAREDGGVVAFVDVRDELKDGKRRVSCGRSDDKQALLSFEGKPLLDEAKTKAPEKEPPAGAAEPGGPAASPRPATEPPPTGRPATRGLRRLGLRALKKLQPSETPASSAPATTAAEPPPAAAAPTVPAPATESGRGDKAEQDGLRELYDCRSFVDDTGKGPWAAGSELVGKRGKDGRTTFSVRFFAERGSDQVTLKTVELGEKPRTVHTFEAPVAQRLKNGSWVLAARFRGALHAFLLSADKKPRRPMQVYTGGYPSMPRFLPDGMDHLLVASQRREGDAYELLFARIDPHKATLPSTLQRPSLEPGAASIAEPSLARSGKQRWLSYQAGERREGQLVMLPVDAELKPVGEKYAVTERQPGVYESLLVGLSDGLLLAVYITNSEAPELVSELLRCSV